MVAALPANYPRIKKVSSYGELIGARFEDGVNALCWPRALDGAFDELVTSLREQTGGDAGVNVIDSAQLSRLRLSQAAARALRAIRSDLQLLGEHDLQPELNCVSQYEREAATAVVATDVYSFHADRAPIEVDTWLCTYYGAPTQGLRNDQATQRVRIAETRAELLQNFGGAEGDAFEDFLRDNSYDLHFAPDADAEPWSFGVGCLWRVAVAWPGALVPPCIHRAPLDTAGTTRLLLIG